MNHFVLFLSTALMLFVGFSIVASAAPVQLLTNPYLNVPRINDPLAPDGLFYQNYFLAWDNAVGLPKITNSPPVWFSITQEGDNSTWDSTKLYLTPNGLYLATNTAQVIYSPTFNLTQINPDRNSTRITVTMKILCDSEFNDCNADDNFGQPVDFSLMFSPTFDSDSQVASWVEADMPPSTSIACVDTPTIDVTQACDSGANIDDNGTAFTYRATANFYPIIKNWDYFKLAVSSRGSGSFWSSESFIQELKVTMEFLPNTIGENPEYLTIDLIQPADEGNYSNSSVPINYNIFNTSSLDKCTAIIDSINYDLAGCANHTVTSIDSGTHHIYLRVNDTNGFANYSELHGFHALNISLPEPPGPPGPTPPGQTPAFRASTSHEMLFIMMAVLGIGGCLLVMDALRRKEKIHVIEIGILTIIIVLGIMVMASML